MLTFGLVVLIMVSMFTVSATAVCSHSSYSPQYSEASHPHAYYKQCLSCGYILYTGGYATKSHGDGSWGSGTCPYCGTHSYSGQSCTSQGVCSCGATTGVLGHSYSNEYCEAEHPHAVYRQCYRCGIKAYTGEHTSKAHGDGTAGSGTCPQCGTHTYVGQSCTAPGICNCGATSSILGHNYSTSYYTANHPHEIYNQCSRCGHKDYTGEYFIKNHGDGTQGSGTCPDCGTHTYLPSSTQNDHPHKVVGLCACGETTTTYPLKMLCTQCSANAEEAYGIASKNVVFTYWESDGVGVGVAPVTFTFYVEYKNLHNYPRENDVMNRYNYPSFASFISNVSSFIEDLPPVYGDIDTIADLSATYYSQTGALMHTQQLAWGENMCATSTGILTLDEAPTYATSGVQCSSGSQFVHVNATAYFH